MTTVRRRKTEDSSPTDYTSKLWDAANVLRGSMDAAEYKHVVLGPDLP